MNRLYLLPALALLSAALHGQNHDQEALRKAWEAIQGEVEVASVDPTRPVYHFMPPARWMNDPNGAFYEDGWYHLFYQINPYGNVWGQIHWGHARSRDNVRWEQLPLAVWPSTENGEDHCYSGSAVRDGDGNWQLWYTSVSEYRAKDEDKGPLDFVFNGQVMLKAMDKEYLHWSKCTDDPVSSPTLPNNIDGLPWNSYIRDPSFFKAGGKTFMLLGSTDASAPIYEAKNGELTRWKYRGIMNSHGWDCPQMIPMGEKWIYIVSKGAPPKYYIGNFDPETARFTEEQSGVLDFGGAHYHTVSFSTDENGRHILYSWITGTRKANGWNNCLALPRVITMGADGHPLQQPVPELAALRGEHYSSKLKAGSEVLAVSGDVLEIKADFNHAGHGACGLRVRRSNDGKRAIDISYDKGELTVAGSKIRMAPGEKMDTLRLHVFIDKSILEIFVNGGRRTITKVIYPPEQDLGIEAYSNGEVSVDVWPLKPLVK